MANCRIYCSQSLAADRMNHSNQYDRRSLKVIRKVKPRLSFQKTFQNNTIEFDGQAAVVSAMISELEC